MKKFSVVLLVCLTVITLAACGRRNDPMPNNTTGSMPTILPTMDTNIPDPDTNGGTMNPTWDTDPTVFGTEDTTGTATEDGMGAASESRK